MAASTPLLQVRSRIDSAAAACNRSDSDIDLIAVSKKKPASAIRALAAEGHRHFGENYPSEALPKIAQADPEHKLFWHFIGAIQSNCTRDLASHFDWVQSVSRRKIAKRLNDQRPDKLDHLNVLVQVNSSGEDSKSGCAPDEALALADFIAELPRLRLRGLMTIPAPREGFDAQLAELEPMQALFMKMRHRHPDVDTLSMGMSSDLEAAICAGSTMVRVGTALFGAREDTASKEQA